jgi:hypothetical protein
MNDMGAWRRPYAGRGNPTAPYHRHGLFVPAGWYRHLDACDAVADGEWDGLSDHNPVVATLSRPDAAARATTERAGVPRPLKPAIRTAGRG